MRKSAFTLLELIFVIVIIGILSKFGIELLFQAYKNFIFSNVNNALQSNSAAAVETIASRLQYRIKDSVIARINSGNQNDFQALASSSYGDTATILEWVGSDIDGFRGDSLPMWSGIIDLRHPNTNESVLVSPGTNTGALNTLIEVLSNGGSDINDSALYFIGSDSDIKTGYGWDGNLTAINTQNGAMHPIHSVNGQPTQFAPALGDFTGIDVYEYYQLAWSAYAVVHTPADGNLTLYYDYQPWQGDGYANANGKVVLMENVDTFRFRAVGSIVKIQVCVKTDLMGDYSLCKEKTIF
ncbi:type II secretion system protein [Sulfurimonas sp. RIFOXYB12_FULL_35_9]|uniref:type II secretion system protein n=1 Tax=Sulfurimonas sp. RIFOXYB12_FULL_35_9 TaxID=1802256 RepID=UPI0008D3F68A|nr:prepilin-type N-terminal cleavage/methylation domain-containing protein [Sulfurimonas sp. RIFOXYB12_FULL_35_9]OHE06168.1 MAG: protein containing prepilin-type N- cleavage/methylation domain protein [Sulfurimonas sp. RIFOXYB12_FULL_35_9]